MGRTFKERTSVDEALRLFLENISTLRKEDKVHPLTVAGDGILSSVTKADGFVLVPENIEGYEEGEEVDVFLIE